MIFNMFQEDAELVSKTLALLNERAGDLLSESSYLHIELRECGTHRKIGEFSDEIGPDAWYYQPVDSPANPI